MQSFDQSLKYLLQREPAAFIRFGLGAPDLLVLGALPSGLPARARDVDAAYLIARIGARDQTRGIADEDKRVVHIELHRRHQALPELAMDVAEAQLRLYRRERHLVVSLVWDLYGDEQAPVLSERTLRYGEAGSQCVYQRVNLRGLGAEELLESGPPSLWALIALTRDGRSEQALAKAWNAIDGRTAWSAAERADHLAVLWFVAEAENVPREVFRAYFAEGRLMESELYKSIFGKGEAKGEARGEAKLLIRLLGHKLGTLPQAVQERIGAVSTIETLEAWYEEALQASDGEALRRLVDKIEATARV